MTDTETMHPHSFPTFGAMLDARHDHDGQGMTQLEAAAHAAEFAARALAVHRDNPLIAALDHAVLGRGLNPDQVTAVISIVAMLEGAPQQPQLMP